MPAIDPERLRRQTAALASLTDPVTLAREALALLEEYSRRSRSGRRIRVSVPDPVQQGIRQALLIAVKDHTDRSIRTAHALWASKIDPARVLASDLLSALDTPEAAGIVERWLEEPVSPDVVQRAGTVALNGWRAADRAAFLARMRRWIEGDRANLAAVGLFALASAASDPSFDDLPALLDRAIGLAESARGETRTAYLELMRELARRSPSETRRLLERELAVGGSRTRGAVRQIGPLLPLEERSRLGVV